MHYTWLQIFFISASNLIDWFVGQVLISFIFTNLLSWKFHKNWATHHIAAHEVLHLRATRWSSCPVPSTRILITVRMTWILHLWSIPPAICKSLQALSHSLLLQQESSFYESFTFKLGWARGAMKCYQLFEAYSILILNMWSLHQALSPV